MKIALACPASLPATQFGGILFLAVDIASELAKQGNDVTIYTTDLDFANNPRFFNKNLPREETINHFKIKRTHVWFSFKLFFVNPGIYSQMKNDRPDIIHTIGVRSFQSLMAALVSKRMSIPLVISDQGGLTTHPDLTESGIITKLVYRLQKPMISFIIKQASRISVANEYERKIFSEFNADNKCTVVRNGINLEQLKSEVRFKEKYGIKERFVLFLGRFSKVKGIDILLKAVSLIKEHPSMKKTKLIIMGADFGFEDQMLRLVKDLQIENLVQVIKKPPREDVIAAYKECEFLVLPSRWELSPLTPLEGFAFRRAVISTNTHGIPYTIEDGKNAVLVGYEDVQQLANAITDLLDNEDKRVQMGNEGYKLVSQVCNSKIMAEQTLRIYQEAIAKPSNR